MISYGSLPARPLREAETDALEDHEKIESVVPYSIGDCSCMGDEVKHLFIKIDGEYVGLDFDEDAKEWRELSRATGWKEASTAFNEKWRDDSGKAHG